MVKCPKCKECELEKEVIFKKRRIMYSPRLAYFKIKWLSCPFCGYKTKKIEVRLSKEQYEKELLIPVISDLKKKNLIPRV